MNRFAILIAAPRLMNHRVLPGTMEDVANLRQWLLSGHGGAWEPSEIATLINPGRAELLPLLARQAECDYAFSAFAGHGYIRSGAHGRQSRVICLRDGEDLPAKKLNPGNKRCTVLIDYCRGLTTEIPSAMINVVLSTRGGTSPGSDDRNRYRSLFESAVQNAEEGVTCLYSCDQDQTAADNDEKGGLFTFKLLKAAREWAWRSSPNAVLRLDEVFASAQAATTARQHLQHPEMIPGGRRVHFPFAVS